MQLSYIRLTSAATQQPVYVDSDYIVCFGAKPTDSALTLVTFVAGDETLQIEVTESPDDVFNKIQEINAK